MENKTKGQCEWALYKGLWHRECCSFLTTTEYGELPYVCAEIPYDGTCPDCGGQVVQIERRFGRGGQKQTKTT